MNLHKILITRDTYSMRVLGPYPMLIDDSLLVLAAFDANVLVASFAFMDPLKFP